MDTDTATTPPRRPRSTLWMIGIAFVAGLLVMVWALARWEGGRAWLLGDPKPSPTTIIAQPRVASAGTLPSVETDPRLALLEARVAQLEAGGLRNAGNGGQGEALLSAFAARRALERGLALGTVEGLLSRHFGATQPRAVATVIAAARQPATLQTLRQELIALSPALAAAPGGNGWWQATRSSIGNLFVVRERGAPPRDPQDRIAFALRQIDAGRVDLALNEVARLPNRPAAARWMASARRYLEANRALDLLEAAAITTQQPARKP